MRVPFETMKTELERVLLRLGFTPAKAHVCATIFAENSRDGVYSHGLNRFPTFVEYVQEGLVNVEAEPTLESKQGCIERWNGNLGPGMWNARFCTERAIFSAKEQGMSCLAIQNTNHWMRGGTYGWQAAEAGCIAICFTNTIANMPPWGGTQPRLGNNPLVIAIPRPGGHVVLDMAMSQYSYGKLQEYELKGEDLPYAGGFDEAGQLSTNPKKIATSQRTLPIGFWKGSGLSLVLDLLATVLSGGKSVQAITQSGKEYGVSQVFICLHLADHAGIAQGVMEQIIEYTKTSQPVDAGGRVSYPGENTLRTRQQNLREGIPVNEAIWQQVRELYR